MAPSVLCKTLGVERAAVSDIPALVELMEAAYLEAAHALDRRWATTCFSALMADPALGTVWLLWHNARTVGYTVLTVGFSMEYGGMTGSIDDLFVRPEHRQHGIGTAALKDVLAECQRRALLALRVEVGRDNVSANRLYQRFGLATHPDGRHVLVADLAVQGADA